MNTEVAQEQAAVAEVEQDLFVTVPETILPGVLGADGNFIRPPILVREFQVARYHASLVDGKLAVTGQGSPLVEINYHEARELCAAAGYALITESQAEFARCDAEAAWVKASDREIA